MEEITYFWKKKKKAIGNPKCVYAHMHMHTHTSSMRTHS